MKFRMLLLALALVAFSALSYGQTWNASFNTWDIEGNLTILTTTCTSQDPLPDGTMIHIWVDLGVNGPSPEDIRPADLSFIDFPMDGVGSGMPGLLSSSYNFQAGGLASAQYVKFYLRYDFEAPGWRYEWTSNSVTAMNNTGNSQDLAFMTWTCVPFPTVVPCEPLTQSVTLVPNTYPFPAAQNNVKACAKVGDGITHIIIPVLNYTNRPRLTIQEGCVDCGGMDCEPLSGHSLSQYAFVPLAPPVVLPGPQGGVCNWAYVCDLSRIEGGTGCCACIQLDFIEPVDAAEITAVPSDNAVVLSWTTGATGVTSWNVIRNGETIANVNADVYSYTDGRAVNGTTYSYKVVGTGANGENVTSAEVNATPMANLAVITKYDVSQNYPNPFNPSTMISFDVLNANYVSLKVYNAMGQEVTTLANGNYDGGKRYTVNFDAKNLTSGLYFYTIKIGNDFSATKKMLLVK